MKQKNHLVTILFCSAVLGFSSNAFATEYDLEVGNEQTWANDGTTTTDGQTVSVRSYVPGSNSITYKNVTIYTPTYTSAANALGDTVGTVYTIYGSGHTGWVDPYDGSKFTVIYPGALHTELYVVNDQRIAGGTYYPNGSFLYDVIYRQFLPLKAPNPNWTSLRDINNHGQVVGMQSNDGGYTRKGFIYDCANGYQDFSIPGSSWTIPEKIDDAGNIYGYMSGIADASYFIARPKTPIDLSGCQLFPRDDVSPPIAFGNDFTFELGADFTYGIMIADFDGNGENDMLMLHDEQKAILYLGESNFDSNIKYTSTDYFNLSQNTVIATQWDFNNDGLYDKVEGDSLNLAKSDGSFHYIPQTLPSGLKAYGDFNGDGLVDMVVVNGTFATIHYQLQEPAPTNPPPADTTTNTTPTDTTTTTTGSTSTGGSTTTSTGDIPAISPDAEQVERETTVSMVSGNKVELTTGQVLWISSDTVITYNDSTGITAGQTIQFKAWENPDGALIAISVELP